MAFPADTYLDAVNLSITASNQLHTILNGDSTTEVIVEDGSKIPSVRKAYIDSLFFLSPQPWSAREYETVYNQLRAFIEPTGITTWWFSKTATVSTPILMSTTPHEDSNWTLWNAINNSVYETQKRLAAEVGLNMVGSFLLGATVTNTDDVVFYETDGKYYKWGGDLPKTILAGTNPHLSGGIGITAWIDSTSYLLKDEVDYNKNKAETDYQSGILSFTTDTGTANAYICTYSPVITSRIEGQVLRFKVANTNTGASTFNDGVGVVPLVGGAHSALQGGELVAGGDAWVQWNSTVGTGSYVLLFCSGAPEQLANGKKSQHAAAFNQITSVVGSARNVAMSITAASATATLTADEVIVETALGGLKYQLSNISKTINLAITGAGGRDTGTAPVSGFVALYVILNTTTGASALLASNATSAKASEVYSGANMPSGYTASALVSVWPTNASGLLVVGYQQDRSIAITNTAAITTTSAGTNASVSVSSIIPKNAKTVSGLLTASTTSSAGAVNAIVAADSAAVIARTHWSYSASNTATTSNFSGLPVLTPQTLWYSANAVGGNAWSWQISINGYTF